MAESVRYYSTTVDVENSMMEIASLLRKYGVRRWNIDYDDESGRQVLRFALPDPDLPGGVLPVRLEPRLERVAERLREVHRIDDPDQVARVAWRQMKGILEGMLLAADGELLNVTQLFLGMGETVVDGERSTFYDLVRQRGAALLTSGR